MLCIFQQCLCQKSRRKANGLPDGSSRRDRQWIQAGSAERGLASVHALAGRLRTVTWRLNASARSGVAASSRRGHRAMIQSGGRRTATGAFTNVSPSRMHPADSDQQNHSTAPQCLIRVHSCEVVVKRSATSCRESGSTEPQRSGTRRGACRHGWRRADCHAPQRLVVGETECGGT